MVKWILILGWWCCGAAHALSLQMSEGLPNANSITRLSKAPPLTIVGGSKASVETTTLSFADLLGDRETVELHGGDATLGVNLPVSARRELLSAQLTLQGNFSNVLIAPSQMLVTLNGQVVGQLQLHGAVSKLNADIVLPVALLHPGYNAIKVRVAQHDTDVCEAPLSPELWTQINLQKSRFTITSTARVTKPLLDGLDQVFDKTTWTKRPDLHVLSKKPPTLGQLQAMSSVVQGVALRYEYVPLRVFAGQYQDLWPVTGQVVLIGSREELDPWLVDLNVPRDGKPVLAVRALPGDSSRTLLLLAANDDNSLQQLAKAFAINELPLPNLPWVSLDKLIVPKLDQLPPSLAMQAAAQTVISLHSLGYRTTTLSGFDVTAKSMNFWNDRWQGRVQMRLHLAYAAGMSPQSAMNVLVNGVMVGSIPLNDDKVGQYDDYSVSVPATVVNPGWNKLELKPVLIPLSHGGKCMPFFLGNLAVTVYDDSTLERLGGSTLREPDLGLFANTGQVELTDASEKLTVQLLDGDADTLSAALTLLSKMTQIQKRPLWHIGLAKGQIPADAGPSILFGKKSLLPADARRDIEASTQYTVDVPLGSPVLGSSLYTLLPPAIRDFFAMNPPEPKRTEARVAISADLSQQVFALTLKRNAGAWTVFSADTPALLARGIDTLTGFGHWEQLNGRFSFWHPDDRVIHSLPVEVAPISAYGLRGGLGIFASQHPWLALLLLLFVIALFVLVLPQLLKLYRVRRHPES